MGQQKEKETCKSCNVELPFFKDPPVIPEASKEMTAKLECPACGNHYEIIYYVALRRVRQSG